MQLPTVSTWFKLCVLIGLVAGLFVAWSTAPVLDRMDARTWRAIGVLVAVVIGVVGVVMMGSWLRASIGTGLGLLVGVAATALIAPTDVSLYLNGFLNELQGFRFELGSMLAAAAGVGAATQWLLDILAHRG